jgi:nicotinamide mononucleotide transporter
MLSSVLAFLESPAFTLFASPATWAELIGAVLGVAMVLCNIRQIHWGWPLAFASSVLYCGVFAGSKLYGDAGLQVFFAAAALWGWAQWLTGQSSGGQARKEGILKTQGLAVQQLTRNGALLCVAASALLWLALGVFLLNFTSTDVPWWDGFTTALSIVATVLLGRKYIENWTMWVLVNAVSMGLFAFKGLWLTFALYGLFLTMAVVGWLAWRRDMQAAQVPIAATQPVPQAR